MPENKPIGPVVGLIIILAIIVLGSIYFWSTRTTYTPPVNTQSTNTDTTKQSATATDAITNQSSSDDLNSIQADLNSYNQADIDKSDSGL